MMPDFLHCELVTVPPNFVDGNAFAIQRPLASAQQAVEPVVKEQSEWAFGNQLLSTTFISISSFV
jgi:hypothetical protein